MIAKYSSTDLDAWVSPPSEQLARRDPMYIEYSRPLIVFTHVGRVQ